MLSEAASGTTVHLCRELFRFNSHQNNPHSWVTPKNPQPNTEVHLRVTSSVYEQHQLITYIKQALVL